MHIVTSLFLPMETEAEDHFVEELIQKMDTNVDGKIDYQEFVHFVHNCGTADILSTQTSRSSDDVSLWSEWEQTKNTSNIARGTTFPGYWVHSSNHPNRSILKIEVFFSGKKDLNRQVLVDSPYWLITPLGFGKPSPKALYGHPPLHGLWYIHLQVTLVVHGNWSSYSPVYSGTKQTFQLKTFTWTKHRLLDYITANPTINARSRKQGCTEPELHPCFLSFFIRLIPTKDITHLIFQVL